MSRPILGGSADVSTVIRIIDSTDGSPETGVVAATAGLALWYRREGATVVALTESDLLATDSAHADGGMIHLSDGLYRVDLPDLAVAAGAGGVTVGGTATGMVVIPSYHPIDPPSDVRKWLGTACATPTTGGVPEVDVTYVAGTAASVEASPIAANVTQISGDSTAADNLEAMLDGTGGTTLTTAITGSITGNLSGSVGSVTGAVGSVTGAVGSVAAGVTLANGAHGGAAATLVLSDYSNFKATGFSTHSAADVVTAIGTGATLTALATTANQTTIIGYVDCLPATWVTVSTTAQIKTAMEAAGGHLALILEDTGTTIPALIDPTGEGAYTGTLTVNDGTTGLEGVVVNATRGGVLIASGTTNASGQITNWVFGAFSYTLAARLSGYQPETDTLTVSGNGWTKSISLDLLASITPPSSPLLSTVYFAVKLGTTPVEGAVCKANLLDISHASDGTILSNAQISATTDSDGAAELSLVRYDQITKGTGRYAIWVEVAGQKIASVETTIPAAATCYFEDLLT